MEELDFFVHLPGVMSGKLLKGIVDVIQRQGYHVDVCSTKDGATGALALRLECTKHDGDVSE